MSFTNAFVETHYTMNGSNITIEKLIQKAISLGYGSLVMTDDRLYGAVKFYKACIKHNINPIIGLQVTIEGLTDNSSNKAMVYAENNIGYQNVLKLASISSTAGTIKCSELQKLKEGIIIIIDTDLSDFLLYYRTNDLNSFNELYTAVTKGTKTYFMQSIDAELNNKLEEIKRLVIIDKVKYLDKEDIKVYDVLGKIFNKTQSNILGKNEEHYFKSKEEVFERYSMYQEALKRTSKMFDHVSISMEFGKTLLPKYTLENNVNAKEYLKALATKGLEKRLRGVKVDKKLYVDRLQYELKVIDQMGYNDYFLIVWDFVKYAKSKKYLVGPGRGSAAASLVSYCLGITSIDSIKYDLVFERFLNPERISMPDIDMDLPDDKRDDIIKYVRDFYGVDKVASICTFGTFLMKSAIRDTARILNVHTVLIEQIIKESEKYDSIELMVNDSSIVQNIMQRDETANTMLYIAQRIEGLQRHVSTHAAGIIVTKDELTMNTAVQPGLLDMMQTQYEAKDLEDLGLLKIDFLGLRNLTSIDSIVQLINETEHTNIDIYKVPVDDQNTFDLLKRVETTGLFQLESRGMRSLIRQMQIDSFEDIVTILALFRPGPMENIPSYLKRRFNEEDVTYPHKILEEILKPTNGIIIYQEQIIKIANLFAGYSFGEADLLRRAVSKKQEDVLMKERSNFVKKAKQNGHDEVLSNEIYDYIVKFANYGFNRAHSVAYAMVSYWMAYLKANYPKYFISVLTSSVIGSEVQMKNYIFEANKLGVRVLKPSVNKSTYIFNPEDSDLRYPLLGIKNLGLSTVKKLLEERDKGPYKSYIDFVMRNGSSVNKRAVEYLVYSGAFDEFGLSKKTLITKYDDVISFVNYGNFIDSKDFVLQNIDEYSYSELEEFEKLALGFNLSMNPIIEHRDYIKKHNLLTPSTIGNSKTKVNVRVVGVLSEIKKIKTKKQDDMAFLVIDDEFNKVDCVLFPQVYNEVSSILIKGNVYLFMATIEERNNNLQLVIHKVHNLT